MNNVYNPMAAFSSWEQPASNGGMGSAAMNTVGFGTQNMNTGYDPMAAFNQANAGVGAGTQQQPSFWSDPSLWGGTNADGSKTMGVVPAGLSALGSVAGTVLGFEQLNLAEDQLKFNQDAFWSQYNQQVADREASSARQKASATGVSQYS